MTLLPCPFCGGSVDLVQHHSPSFRVVCSWCDSCGGRGASGDEAAEKWNRRASYAAHLPAVMAATEPVELDRPLVMVGAVEPTEAPCRTCRYAGSLWGRHTCQRPPDPNIDPDLYRYRYISGAVYSADGLPTNRDMRCPGWAAKETT